MPIMTMACIHNHYAKCTSKLCECECHHPDRPTLLAQAREDAHQAVKAFDRKPDHANTQASIAALSLYLGLLSQGFDRTPKTRDEQATFARGWDATVAGLPLSHPDHPSHVHEDCCK